MSHADRRWLLVAQSARALAQSARRSGARVAVVDLYNDMDTKEEAERMALLRVGPDGSAIAVDRLLGTAREICPPDECAGVVCGSGFETSPAALDALGAVYPLFGNSGAVTAAVKDPLGLSGILDDCGLPHPETRLAPPDDPAGWMAKRVGASGGGHVMPADDGSARCAGTYFQRRAAGASHSVSFLSDGRKALVLGFNQTWTRRVGASAFCYGGAVNRTALSQDVTRDIMSKLDSLVQRTGLVGLNGVDFVAHGSEYAVIEINPRPCATLDLYDEDYDGGMFMLHVDACRGSMPEAARRARFARAHGVVYTERPLVLPARFVYPPWCRDRSQPGTRFEPGSPLCTVHASGRDAPTALRELADREQTLSALISNAISQTDPDEARV